MSNKISVLFFIKKTKTNKLGLAPIYIRITINGERFELATGKNTDVMKWSSEAGKIIGKSEDASSVNAHLDALKVKVFNIETALTKKSEILNVQDFKNKFLGTDEKQRMLISIFELHNKKMKALVPNQYSENTLKKFKTTLKHLQEFILKEYNMTDIAISRINIAFINDFDFYLRAVKSCNNNSTVKYVRNFSKIIRECYQNEWIARDPFYNYKFTLEHVEIEFLAQHEIDSMYAREFSITRLELVRDIYIFSCYTGLAYIDIDQLTKDNLVIGIDGSKWIFKNRQKTDIASHIPLLPIAEEILEKYKNHPRSVDKGKLLPILSNQKMNSYLKEIADICGIKKELTFHSSRHTFGTTVTLANGVPIESVSKMLGHGSLRTTQHYARVLDLKVSDDMNALKQKLSGAANKTVAKIVVN